MDQRTARDKGPGPVDPGQGNPGTPEADAPAAGLSFLEHLAELRRRLIACLAVVAALTALAWNFAGPILDLVMRPVLRLLPREAGLVYTGLPDAFSVTFRVSLWAGVILAAPFCLFQLWAFVAPGLRPGERARVPALALLATVLFLGGVAFAYFLAFPITFGFFLGFSSQSLQPLLAVDRYMSLVMGLALAFAVSFQLPLVLTFLARLGLVSPEFLRARRPYAIVAIFILAAVLTPPDVVSQILLAAALLILYELSILMVSRQARALARAEAEAPRDPG
ncbi:MAG: twin-arginine translocase subunit TatC [Deltaproteobacteria bacterium]|nr:twin-arginine translocase subunit TatC [Deltaproteobacteria bacterium]